MSTPKKARQRSLLQFLALLIAVVIIIVAAVLAQNWWNNRPGPAPQDITVTARVGDSSLEVSPYLVCEPGLECPEGEVPNLAVGPDDTLVLEIPEPIHDHDWQLLMIYDDPAVNDQQLHGPYDTEQVEIPGSVDPVNAGDPRPRLMVVEISSAQIGPDAEGQETPYATVWSLSTMVDPAED
ncbi:DUF2771 domain-containing protein [Corynebacterium sp. YIM 101645]|uniref:DUF2771 domain-containing protein n=1 Tax=Corynebacterium lemuris TaxID=1859292 RepID=A0ABT2FZ07_9CORY|nr:DUF2771 domain-containing protein [Corynebacterium lemuris]MCS5480477.1 DUF2771 domain-containing protein [Corynebacterium lemuris]